MKVLVAVDNKPSSQAIVDALIKMRWFEGTEISLLHVLPEGVVYGTDEAAANPDVAEVEALVVELHKCLKYCEVSFFAKSGEPAQVILDFAENLDADLIVLGSNCKNTLERVLIGSVCQTVLNRAKCPVIVAKTPCCLARLEDPGFKNILLPIDNSVFTDAAVKWLTSFSWTADTNFIVAAAVEEGTDLVEVQESLNRRASDLSRLLETNRVIIECAIGHPTEKICDLAKQYYADLIVMGSHGRTGVRKMFLGSVSQAVSREAPCAVAIVRGLVRNDTSWMRTGAFHKVTPASIEALVGGGDDTAASRGDISAHIMPGGM